MIVLYCGIGEREWNKHPVAPGGYGCVSPVKGRSERTKTYTRVFVPPQTRIIQDSGAFCDGPQSRLSFAKALDRQIRHAEKWGYSEQIEYRASYDLLIDEIWDEGNRHKRRWSESDATSAVKETIAAARYLNQHRSDIPLIQSAQGVTAQQYLECSRGVLSAMQDGDVFGLGGWCIIGKMPRVMMPTFRETILSVIPLIASEGITKAHIWGVIYPKALGELLWMCDQCGIALSTDSAGPCTQPIWGEWGYAEWRDNSYERPDVSIRGLERARHVECTREWLARFRSTKHYREPKPAPRQLTLF